MPTSREAVIAVFRRHLDAMRCRLPNLISQAEAFRTHPDWPWNAFVLSFATQGGVKNWENNVRPRMEQLSWRAVSALDDSARVDLLREVPNLRYRKMLSAYLETAYQLIRVAGGPAVVRADYERLNTAEKRIAFFMGFKGIGQKYGRNIPMDAYDPLVRNHFALDHRLKSILRELSGKKKMSYQEGEDFLRSIALTLNIDGWTFDRILFNRWDAIVEDLEGLRI